MTQDGPEQLGRLDDEQEAAEESSTTEGAAARGEADASEGSPGAAHPVGDDYPDQATPRSEPADG